MTDWGGLSVKELSQNLKDALLDVLGGRLLPANAANPLATIEDVLNLGGSGGPGSGAGAQLDHATIAKTDTDFSTASLTPVAIPGTTLAFVLPVGQTVIFAVHATTATFGTFGGFRRHDTQLGIEIDGVPFFEAHNRGDWDFFSSGDSRESINFVLPKALISGPHTVKVIIKRGGLGSLDAALKVTPETPVRLSAIWSVAAPTRASKLLAPTVASVAGLFSTPSTTFVPVPGTSVPFLLDQAQEVVVLADATRLGLGGSVQKGHVGIRVDGVDYPTHSHEIPVSGVGRHRVGGHVTVTLTAGPHTAEMVVRRDVAGAGTFDIASDADGPSRVTVIASEPIFGVGALRVLDAASGAPFSTSSTSFVAVPGTLVPITLITSQEIMLAAQATAEIAPGPDKTHVALGIRINNVVTPATIDVPGSRYRHETVAGPEHSAGAEGGISAVARVTLPAGTHSAELVVLSPTGAAEPAKIRAGARLVAVLTKNEAFPKSIGFLKKGTIRLTDFSVSGSALVPSTDVTFTLSKTQDVMIVAQTAGLYSNVLFGQNRAFLRHTEDPGGADIVTDYKIGETFESDGGDFVAGSTGANGTLVIGLGPGTHKVQLFVSNGVPSLRAPMQINVFAQEPIA